MLRKKEKLSLLSNAALIAFTLGYLLNPAPLAIARQEYVSPNKLLGRLSSKMNVVFG